MLHQETIKPTPRRVHAAKSNGKPLAISKMDREELEDFVDKVGVIEDNAAIRICECCILIAEV